MTPESLNQHLHSLLVDDPATARDAAWYFATDLGGELADRRVDVRAFQAVVGPKLASIPDGDGPARFGAAVLATLLQVCRAFAAEADGREVWGHPGRLGLYEETLKHHLRSLSDARDNASAQEAALHFAAELGTELASDRLDVLRFFQRTVDAELRAIPGIDVAPDHRATVLATLLQVCRAYDAGVAGRVERETERKLWTLKGLRDRLLVEMKGNGSSCPTDLAHGLKTDLTAISRLLKEMREDKLVAPVVRKDASPGDRRARPYRLTPRGRSLAGKIEGRLLRGRDGPPADALPDDLPTSCGRPTPGSPHGAGPSLALSKGTYRGGSAGRSRSRIPTSAPSRSSRMPWGSCSKAISGRGSRTMRAGGYFDVVRRPGIATYNEVVYLFPFFMTPQRRTTWGVLPYARHTQLGLLLHKTHLHRKRLMDDIARQGDEPESLEWLANLLAKVEELDGKIFAVDGYLHDELLPLMVLKLGDDPSGERFYRVGQVVEPREKERMGIFDSQAKRQKNVRVIDLADRRDYEPYLKKGFQILEVRHTLDIPVGIGYSLLMLPMLIEGGLWKEMLGVVRKHLGRPEIVQKLSDVGIEVDGDVRSPILASAAEH